VAHCLLLIKGKILFIVNVTQSPSCVIYNTPRVVFLNKKGVLIFLERIDFLKQIFLLRDREHTFECPIEQRIHGDGVNRGLRFRNLDAALGANLLGWRRSDILIWS
jgi:hypothetical protein